MKNKPLSSKKNHSAPSTRRSGVRAPLSGRGKGKNGSSTGSAAEERCQQLCDELRDEMGKMSRELAAVQAERDQYLKALYALTREDIDFDKKTLLAELGQKPTLEELISELESRKAR
jgi:hypothetical protein